MWGVGQHKLWILIATGKSIMQIFILLFTIKSLELKTVENGYDLAAILFSGNGGFFLTHFKF